MTKNSKDNSSESTLLNQETRSPIVLTYICNDDIISDLIYKYSNFTDMPGISFVQLKDIESIIDQELKTDILIIDIEDDEEMEIILESVEEGQFADFETILFCAPRDAETLYNLVIKGKITDYFIVRPLFDPRRLRILLRHSIERRTLRRFINVASPMDNKDETTVNSWPPKGANCYECFPRLLSFGSKNKNFVEILNSVKSSMDTLNEESKAKNEKQEIEGEKPVKEDEKDKYDKVKKLLPFEGMKALIIEDDKPSSEMLCDMLITEGFAVETSICIEEAISLYQDSSFDIMFVDLMLPGVGGPEGIKVLNQMTNFQEVPKIVTTAYSEEDLVIKCIEQGAVQYIIKPITRLNLFPRVASELGIEWEKEDNSD